MIITKLSDREPWNSRADYIYCEKFMSKYINLVLKRDPSSLVHSLNKLPNNFKIQRRMFFRLLNKAKNIYSIK
jgi:hypothetical protein